MESKKDKISNLVKNMLKESHEDMLSKIDKILNSGCIDIESWEENNNPMIIPKSIVIAILNHESKQYGAKGTSFEKLVNKEVKNISYFI